jgi:hypothetical protein
MRGAHGFAVSLDLTSVLRICAGRAQKLCITGIFRLLMVLLLMRRPNATSDLLVALFNNTMIRYHFVSQFIPCWRHVHVSATLCAVNFNPFSSNTSLSGLVFVRVAALFSFALCLFFYAKADTHAGIAPAPYGQCCWL